MVIVVSGHELEAIPDTLEDFFELYPTIGKANQTLTSIQHVNMWRDQVLFIKQRQQATSDFRENPNVRWIGQYHLVSIMTSLLGAIDDVITLLQALMRL